jgi:hypothetical protein
MSDKKCPYQLAQLQLQTSKMLKPNTASKIVPLGCTLLGHNWPEVWLILGKLLKVITKGGRRAFS